MADKRPEIRPEVKPPVRHEVKGEESRNEERRAEEVTPTYTQTIADRANETGIKPGDLIAGSDMRTVTSPEQAITAAQGGMMTTDNVHQAPKADIPAVAESQQAKFDRVMQEVSGLLSKTPHAMTIELSKDGGVHRYGWGDKSNEATKSREDAAKKLRDLYQSGAYSYSQFADRLRLSNKDLQALMDDDWREQQGIA